MTAKRKNRRLPGACAALLAVSMLLTGCWDRREINDIAIVVASAIDLEPDGRFRFSVEVPLPSKMGAAQGGGGSSGGGDKSYYIDSEVGKTIKEAMSTLQNRMPRVMTLAHRRVLLVSEDVAKTEGIRRLFDETARVPENRLTGYMIITQGKALDVLAAKPKFERFSEVAIRKLARGGGTLAVNMKNVARSLAIPGSDPVIAYMGHKEKKDSKENASEIQFLGFAQFRDEKMVDVMGEEPSKGLSWLKRTVRPYTGSISVNGKERTNVQILEGKTLILPYLDRNKQIGFRIDIQARVAVLETREGLDFGREETLNAVSRKTEELIKYEVNKTLELIQKNRADSANLGQTVHHIYPDQWKNYLSKRWDEELKNAATAVTVKATVVQTGLITENIAKKVHQ